MRRILAEWTADQAAALFDCACIAAFFAALWALVKLIAAIV